MSVQRGDKRYKVGPLPQRQELGGGKTMDGATE